MKHSGRYRWRIRNLTLPEEVRVTVVGQASSSNASGNRDVRRCFVKNSRRLIATASAEKVLKEVLNSGRGLKEIDRKCTPKISRNL